MKTKLLLLSLAALLAGCATHRPQPLAAVDRARIEVGSLWRFKTLTEGGYHDTRQPANVFKVVAVSGTTVATQRAFEPAPTVWLWRSQFLAEFEPR